MGKSGSRWTLWVIHSLVGILVSTEIKKRKSKEKKFLSDFLNLPQ